MYYSYVVSGRLISLVRSKISLVRSGIFSAYKDVPIIVGGKSFRRSKISFRRSKRTIDLEYVVSGQILPSYLMIVIKEANPLLEFQGKTFG